MRIDLKTFRIPYNYVLIKPDADLETYQIKGKELGLIAPSFKYEGEGENTKRISVKERNQSVFGTVYITPETLRFNLYDILALKNQNTTHKVIGGKLCMVNFPIQFQIDHLLTSSVQYNTEIEVQPGQRVNFSYMAHKQATGNGLIFETDEGLMYLIKYDMLFATMNGNEIEKMLNGWMLIEPEEIEVKTEGAQEFIEREHGIVLLAPKSKLKKNRKNQIGKVVKAGNICRGYLQEPEKHDGGFENLKSGDKIVYDPRMAQKLEYDTHQILSGKTLHLVQRKDVWFGAEAGFDFSQMSFERRKR